MLRWIVEKIYHYSTYLTSWSWTWLTYRKRFDEIFGKKEKIYPENAFSRGIRKQMKRREKTLHEELMEGFRKEQEELTNEEE